MCVCIKTAKMFTCLNVQHIYCALKKKRYIFERLIFFLIFSHFYPRFDFFSPFLFSFFFWITVVIYTVIMHSICRLYHFMTHCVTRWAICTAMLLFCSHVASLIWGCCVVIDMLVWVCHLTSTEKRKTRWQKSHRRSRVRFTMLHPPEERPRVTSHSHFSKWLDVLFRTKFHHKP